MLNNLKKKWKKLIFSALGRAVLPSGQAKAKKPVSDGHFAGSPCFFCHPKDVTVLERKDFIFSTFVVKNVNLSQLCKAPNATQ